MDPILSSSQKRNMGMIAIGLVSLNAITMFGISDSISTLMNYNIAGVTVGSVLGAISLYLLYIMKFKPYKWG
jgi:hypothetical protein